MTPPPPATIHLPTAPSSPPPTPPPTLIASPSPIRLPVPIPLSIDRHYWLVELRFRNLVGYWPQLKYSLALFCFCFQKAEPVFEKNPLVCRTLLWGLYIDVQVLVRTGTIFVERVEKKWERRWRRDQYRRQVKTSVWRSRGRRRGCAKKTLAIKCSSPEGG